MAKRIQTIESTGKRWKFLILVSNLALIAGIAWMWTIGLLTEWHGNQVGPVLTMFSAAFVGVVGRVGKWWYHE